MAFSCHMLIVALLSLLGEFNAQTVAELGAQNGRRVVRLRSGFVVVRSGCRSGCSVVRRRARRMRPHGCASATLSHASGRAAHIGRPLPTVAHAAAWSSAPLVVVRLCPVRSGCVSGPLSGPIGCGPLLQHATRASAPLVCPVRCPVRSVAVRSVVRLPTRPHAELGARCGPFVGSLRVHATRPLVVASTNENRGMRARPM